MTVNDLLTLVNAYLGKFSGDTTEEQTAKINFLNIAKNIISAELGLPFSEKKQTINFLQEKENYLLNSDFTEPISLSYDESFGSLYEDINQSVEFEYCYPEDIIKKPKESSVVRWSIEPANIPQSGNLSLFVKALAVRGNLIINDCDDTTNWSVSDDATNLTVDTLKFQTGSGSLKFKIDETLSGNQRATLKLQNQNFDLSSYVNLGNFFINLYMVDTTGLSSITLKWGQNSSNYYYVAQTTNVDGTLYNNSWNEFIFDWNNASTVGSPTADNVSYFEINIDYNETNFNSPQFWNLDTLQIISPDRFVLRYYSNLLVKDGSTSALKTKFENTNDIALYATTDPSLGDLTVRIAAMIYKPLANLEQNQTVSFMNSFYSAFLEPYKLRYPKRLPMYYRGRLAGPSLRW